MTKAEQAVSGKALALTWPQPDIALVDVCLPDRSGFEVVKCIRQLVPTCAAIVLCDNPDPCVEAVAQIIGAKAVWHKGSGVNQLSRMLRRLVHAALVKPEPDLTAKSFVP